MKNDNNKSREKLIYTTLEVKTKLKYQVDDIYSSPLSHSASFTISDSQDHIKCIGCENMVDETSVFINACPSCDSVVQQIMKHVRHVEDLVCVGDPPCWSNDNISKCNACIIQSFILLGLKFGIQYKKFRKVTLNKLRSSEMISSVRETLKIEGERLLKSINVKSVTEWCVISHKESLSVPCQWDINIFKETEVQDNFCVICQKKTSTNNSLYNIIPSNKHFICHQCLLRTYEVKADLSQSSNSTCVSACSDVLSCDNCLLIFCKSLFPLSAIQRRYRRNGNEISCKLCGEDGKSNVDTLRSGSYLCFVCIWRIRTYAFSSVQKCSGSCRSEDCVSCHLHLTSCLINLHEVITHNTFLEKENSKSYISELKKNSIKSNYDHINTLNIENKASGSESPEVKFDAINTISRQKRPVKPTQFQDYFVGESINAVFSRKGNSSIHEEESMNKTKTGLSKKRESLRLSEICSNFDENKKLQTNHKLTKEINPMDEDKILIRENKSMKLQIESWINKNQNVSVEKNESNINVEDVYRPKNKNETNSLEVEELQELKETEDIITEMSKCRRIKHPVPKIFNNSVHISRPSGPRVKQVSCQEVSKLDCNIHKNIAKTNHMSLTSNNKSEESRTKQSKDSYNKDDDEDSMTIEEFQEKIARNKVGEKVEKVPYIGTKENTKSNKFLPFLEVSVKNVTYSSVIASQSTEDLDVYRDSDQDDIVSLEENIDPDLDNINTIKSEIITTAVAHDGGYPIVTSHRAMPNKVLCFSCGSGGDQMIHCVSCAEPFHFFCIEFQFRPKSKEMFVCRNCTKCHSCNNYGSDLKCIKCQLGFHPSCIDKYLPSHSEDKSNWVCYKCAMCLHCGIKAEDVINQTNSDVKQIDWSKDPWQCGRCYQARKDGHICPECDRAYQTGLETIKCYKCNKSVHRQCAGLTEDEYEVLKSVDQNINYECSKCESNESENSSLRQCNIKPKYKKYDLKIYCKKLITRRINDLIHLASTKEEHMLNECQLGSIEVKNLKESVFLSQLDGIDDNDNTNLSMENSSGVTFPENATDVINEDFTVVMRDSSESVEEFDLEQLTTLEQDDVPNIHQQEFIIEQSNLKFNNEDYSSNSKIGIFSRIVALNFLCPRHLILESLARIKIRQHEYNKHSILLRLYNNLIMQLNQMCGELFPWIDFEQCIFTVLEIMKKNSGRITLVLKMISEIIKNNGQREIEVFSSSVWDIEEKLHNSLVKGREEFIIFHSEQHLNALMHSIKSPISDNSDCLFSKYKMAFSALGQDPVICEKDMRRCVFCNGPGDDGLEGRLIYGSQDVWMHVNCVLWSDEVYEQKDGALVNVEVAMKRGRHTICASCSNYGATLQCSSDESIDGFSKSCTNSYHFGCAFNCLIDPVFTESRTFYCSEMHEKSKIEKQLGLSDMLILRRIYMPLSGLDNLTNPQSQKMSAEDIVVTIGNLRIDCLGTLKEYSDSSRKYLCPVDYKARRLFWSTKELNSLVLYFMNITDEPNKAIYANQLVVPRKPLSAPHAIMKRQRMIDTVDSRIATKKIRSTDNRREVIYEMDDLGNLLPLTSNACYTKNEPLKFQSLAVPLEIQKCNRRFPKENQVRKHQDKIISSMHLPLLTDSKVTSGVLKPDSQNPDEVSKPIDISNNNNPMLAGHIYQKQLNNQIITSNLCTAPMPFNINQSISRIVRFKHHNINVPKIVQVSKHPHITMNLLPSNQHHLKTQIIPINHQYYATQKSIPVLQHYSNSPSFIPINHQLPNTIALNRSMVQSSVSLNHDLSRSLTFSNPKENQLNNTKINYIPLKTFTKPATIINICPRKIISTNNHNSAVNFSTKTNYNPNNQSLSQIWSSSLLRTALTDSTRSFTKQHSIDCSSEDKSQCVISSCGSFVKKNQPSNTFNQFDGETDEFSIIDDSDSSMDSTEVDSVSPKIMKSNKTTKKYIEYDSLLKYNIEGFNSSRNPKSVWTYIVRRVANMRANQGFTEYPLKTSDGWTKFGINHRYVVFLIEQMVGGHFCRQYQFKYRKTPLFKFREQLASQIPLPINGCRSFHWTNNQPEHMVRDPLAFLRCKANLPPRNHAPEPIDISEFPEPDSDYIQKLAMQFRSLKSGVLARAKNVCVSISQIHSRGLFARRQFAPHEIIIEYVGETIRSILSDVREARYQKSGVDCYMFRLDQDLIVDATYKGNAARFINHCCQPNCYAKVVKLEGDKHIIIIAQRRIYKGEELTYDYRFPIEEDKLACSCGSRRCRKYLN